MRDTRPINMLILTVFMIILIGFSLAAASARRPQSAAEIRPAVQNQSSVYSDGDNAQNRQWALPVFHSLTTLSAELCHVIAHNGLVQYAGGRLPGTHSLTLQPAALICSVYPL